MRGLESRAGRRLVLSVSPGRSARNVCISSSNAARWLFQVAAGADMYSAYDCCPARRGRDVQQVERPDRARGTGLPGELPRGAAAAADVGPADADGPVAGELVLLLGELGQVVGLGDHVGLRVRGQVDLRGTSGRRAPRATMARPLVDTFQVSGTATVKPAVVPSVAAGICTVRNPARERTGARRPRRPPARARARGWPRPRSRPGCSPCSAACDGAARDQPHHDDRDHGQDSQHDEGGAAQPARRRRGAAGAGPRAGASAPGGRGARRRAGRPGLSGPPRLPGAAAGAAFQGWFALLPGRGPPGLAGLPARFRAGVLGPTAGCLRAATAFPAGPLFRGRRCRPAERAAPRCRPGPASRLSRRSSAGDGGRSSGPAGARRAAGRRARRLARKALGGSTGIVWSACAGRSTEVGEAAGASGGGFRRCRGSARAPGSVPPFPGRWRAVRSGLAAGAAGRA